MMNEPIARHLRILSFFLFGLLLFLSACATPPPTTDERTGPAPADTRVAAFLAEGARLQEEGAYDRAIMVYNKALALDDKDADIYFNRAVAWEGLQNIASAIADYQRAISLAPDLAKAHNNLAWLLATSPIDRYRDGTRAVELAKKAAALRPGPLSLDTLAAAYAEAGLFAQAVRTQEQVIEELRRQRNSLPLLPFEERLRYYRRGIPWRSESP